jgi:hypothetical protein
MDTDKSGNLSREELAAGLANAEDLGFRVRDKSALDRVFDALDTDHSNSISWKEFVRVCVCVFMGVVFSGWDGCRFSPRRPW